MYAGTKDNIPGRHQRLLTIMRRKKLTVRLKYNPPGMWDKAKCRSLEVTRDNDPFFSEDDIDLEEATVYCRGIVDNRPCRIQQDCMVFALANHCREGVWGGTLPSQRKWIRQQYPMQGKTPRPEWTLKIVPPANSLSDAYNVTEQDYVDDDEDCICCL